MRTYSELWNLSASIDAKKLRHCGAPLFFRISYRPLPRYRRARSRRSHAIGVAVGQAGLRLDAEVAGVEFIPEKAAELGVRLGRR